MEKYILVITASNFYGNSKNLENSFIKEFSRPQRIVFTEDININDKHVSGIIQELIEVKKGLKNLKKFIKNYIKNNDLSQECFGVYNVYNLKKEILTESNI